MVPGFLDRRRVLVQSVVALAVAMGMAIPGFASTSAQEEVGFTTQARFLHADTDGREYEVFINGNNVLDQFAYGDESDWFDVDPGAVRLTLTADRTGFNYVMFDAVYPVVAGNSFNVIITDALVIGSAIDASELNDDMARVRVTHASADTPNVDVIVSGSDTAIASDLHYGRSSEYIDVPAGAYDLDVLVAETGDVALPLPGVELEAGMVYDFVAIGTAGDDDKPLSVTPLVSEARGAADSATPAA
jgi:hypothetical protein